MTRERIHNMTEKEFSEFIEEVEKKIEEDRQKQIDKLFKEINKKINKLSEMDIETVGKAYICYAKAIINCDDIGITSDAVLDAYMLICDIEAFNIC